MKISLEVKDMLPKSWEAEEVLAVLHADYCIDEKDQLIAEVDQ
jgi:hypothetical protein